MQRPKGSPSKWSLAQAARYVRYLVSTNAVFFVNHAGIRGMERSISNEEMLAAVRLGRPVSKESATVRGNVEERIAFKHRFASRGADVVVVTAISDDYPECLVITTYESRP